MSDRHLDFEELRPTGEASQIFDGKFEGCGGGEPHRQRVATNQTGYPNVSTESENECRSCSVSISADRTKRRFCLTNHLSDEATNIDEPANATLLGIVHLVVESTTFYGAVAKSGAAATLRVSSETEQIVDDYTRLYGLGEAPARQLGDRWPSLPARSGSTARRSQTSRQRTSSNGD